MSGPNVVDKAKMVFHYVAKLAPPRPPTSQEEPNAGREMKVCFRHSKHSIKCDVSAPCLECDAGLKLYSYEQCRRHLDVVRSERRFESIEVDRSENQIEKLTDIDENGKKMAQLLEAMQTKQELIAKSLQELSQRKSSLSAEEEREAGGGGAMVLRESMNASLKEISRNTLRTQKKEEEVCEQLLLLKQLVEELIAKGVERSHSQQTGLDRLCEVNRHLESIRLKIEENSSEVKESKDCFRTAVTELQTNGERVVQEIREMKEFVRHFESSLQTHLQTLREEFVRELQTTRRELTDSQTELRSQLTEAVVAVKQEMQTLKSLSQTFVAELRDSLPEKLMDVFGGILMLSADNSRKMDTNAALGDECAANASSLSQQFHLNQKNEF